MLLSGEAYDQRLDTFSDSTIRLMLEALDHSREVGKVALDMAPDTEVTEEQIVATLKRLLKKDF